MTGFLNKLQENINLREGIEGYREILREIYRAGNISLHDLSYKTRIPISVLSKVINFLIEKEILSRIPEGILFTEQGMQFIEKELVFYGYGLAICDKCEGNPIYLSPRWDDILDKLKILLQNRPTVDTTLDQAFADAETNLRRALLLYQRGALEGKKVCFLGDDDFTSIAISYLYLGFFPDQLKLIPKEIAVIDIDPRILDGINSEVKNLSIQIETNQWDYRTPVPKDFLNRFDVVLIDPPYSKNGLLLGLSRCLSLLKQSPGMEIYLSFAHRPIEDSLEIQQIITKMGLVIQEKFQNFNTYEGAGILGGTTQIFRLVSTLFSKPAIKSGEEYKEKIYTGEINPTIRYYYCSNCSKLISVGNKSNYKTIELLKSSKCPHCGSDGPFELDKKICE